MIVGVKSPILVRNENGIIKSQLGELFHNNQALPTKLSSLNKRTVQSSGSMYCYRLGHSPGSCSKARAYAQADSGQLPLDKTELDLNALIEQVRELFTPLAGEAGLTLHTSTP